MKPSLLFILLLPGFALASGDCRDGSCNDVRQIAGDANAETSNVIEGDDALGLGFGMGDVDINDHRYSVQFLFAQWTRTNFWTMANELDARGQHEQAAVLRCEDRQIRKAFGGKKLCRIALELVPDTTGSNEVENGWIRLEETHDRQIAHIASLFAAQNAKISQLEADQAEQQERAKAAYRRAQDEEESERQTVLETLQKLQTNEVAH